MSETFNMQAAEAAFAAFDQASVVAFDRQIAAARRIVKAYDAFVVWYGQERGSVTAFAGALGRSQGHVSKVLAIGRATDKQIDKYRKPLADPTVWDFYSTVLKTKRDNGSKGFDPVKAAHRIGDKLTPEQRKALAAALLAL